MIYVEHMAKARYEKRTEEFTLGGVTHVVPWSELPDEWRRREVEAMRAAVASVRNLTADIKAFDAYWDIFLQRLLTKEAA